MNSKKRLLVLYVAVTVCGPLQAQVNITLPQSSITDGTDFSINLPTTDMRSAFTTSVQGRINVAASTAVLGGVGNTAGNIPLSRFFLKLVSIGGVSMPASSTEINLSTQSRELCNRNFSQRSGSVVIGYRLPVPDYGWVAGSYQTNLLFTYYSLAITSLGTNKALNLTVPAFITAPLVQAAPNVRLLVNSLDYFRNKEVFTSISLGNITGTLPFNLGLMATASTFSYNPASGNTGTPVPNAAVNLVNASINTLAPVILKNTEQPLFGSDVPVPIGNRTTAQLRYSMNSESLKLFFTHAGTYSVPLAYRVYSPGNTVSANGTGSMLTVEVAEMGELLVNTPVVNLALNTAADYVNGTFVDVPGHLHLSKTIPYDLYVRTSSPNLTNGANTIPVSVITIKEIRGRVSVPTVTLSATPVRIFLNAPAIIDRIIGIRYAIDPAAAKTLVGKAPGIYTVNVIYSFVAN